MSPTQTQRLQIIEAVDALFDEQIEFLKDIVRIPSQRGLEE